MRLKIPYTRYEYITKTALYMRYLVVKWQGKINSERRLVPVHSEIMSYHVRFKETVTLLHKFLSCRIHLLSNRSQQTETNSQKAILYI